MAETILARFQNNMPAEVDGVFVMSRFNRRYLSGFDSSDGALVITRNTADGYFDSRYLEDAQKNIKGFELNLLKDSVWQQVSACVKKRAVKRLGFEDKQLTYFQWQKLSQTMPDVELVPCSEAIDRMRIVKTAAEIKSIRSAQKITDEIFSEIVEYIKPGITELDIALQMETAMRKKGAQGPSFETIVLSGKNTSIPHGKPSSRKITSGDFVTMDFGCIVDGYCSDMTRTIAVGSPSSRMREVYETVLRAQQAAIDGIKAGISGKAADALARKVIEDAGFGEFFGHALGHGIGLEVHEDPRFSPHYDQAVPAGAVMSVEPGIYIPGTFGVRIEDMVVLTEGGCENLTKSCKQLLVL